MKNTERFSDRVSNYVEYRPSYPTALIDTLISECGLHSESVIADIGSGTGKFTELLLNKDLPVIGVEPNKEMREAAETLFDGNVHFDSVDGDCSNTSLQDNSIDLITAAQAFHWFDPVETKQEFQRILKAESSIALIWNQRDIATDFQNDYDQMLNKHCPEYSKLNHRLVSDDKIQDFCQPNTVRIFTYPYKQSFDLASFIGRMFSSSYTPKKDTPEYQTLAEAAGQLFEKYQQNDKVDFAYETKLYLA